MILVSACLLGHKVKYNGGSNDHALLQAVSARGRFVAVCPECFAMLPVPRPPMEIQYGTGRKLLEGRARAVDVTGHDLTASMLLGAQKILWRPPHLRRHLFRQESARRGRCDRTPPAARPDRLLRRRSDSRAPGTADRGGLPEGEAAQSVMRA